MQDKKNNVCRQATGVQMVAGSDLSSSKELLHLAHESMRHKTPDKWSKSKRGVIAEGFRDFS